MDVRRLSGDTYEITTHEVGIYSDTKGVMNANDEVATKY